MGPCKQLGGDRGAGSLYLLHHNGFVPGTSTVVPTYTTTHCQNRLHQNHHHQEDVQETFPTAAAAAAAVPPPLLLLLLDERRGPGGAVLAACIMKQPGKMIFPENLRSHERAENAKFTAGQHATVGPTPAQGLQPQP